MGPDVMIFIFWMLSFKPTFSLSTFAFVKRFFSSSSLSAIRVVSSAFFHFSSFHFRRNVFLHTYMGFPGGLLSKESTYQCRWLGFYHWVGKILQRRKWQHTPVFLTGKSHGQRSLLATIHGVTRVGHDWATSLSLFTFMHWRRKWQPTPVFLPGESQGWGSLVGCRLWGRTESNTTEAT